MSSHFQYRVSALFALTALVATGCAVAPWLRLMSFEMIFYVAAVALLGVGALLAVLGWRR